MFVSENLRRALLILLRISCVVPVLVGTFHLTIAQTTAPSISDQNATQHLYEFKRECPVFRSDILGNRLDSTYVIAPAGARFVLIDLRQDLAVIRFVIARSKSTLINTPSVSKEDVLQYKYFTITRAQLDFKASQIVANKVSFCIGNVVNTAKFRMRPFELGKEISLGPSAGIRFPIGRSGDYHFMISVNIGFSTISIDSFTTSGKIKAGVSEDLFGFSPGGGLVYAFGSAQIGVFTGMDILPGRKEIHRYWIYRKQPWIALGIGFSIYSGSLKP